MNLKRWGRVRKRTHSYTKEHFHHQFIKSELVDLLRVLINEQVRRNLDRFPEDFMFQLTSEEYEFLKSQFATSKHGSGGKQKLPLVFTENGVAMLSSILNSKQAIKVNISIMRIFTKLRSFHMLEENVARQIGEIKSNVVTEEAKDWLEG